MNEETIATICEGCARYVGCNKTCHAYRILNDMGYDVKWGHYEVLVPVGNGKIGKSFAPRTNDAPLVSDKKADLRTG